MFHSLTHDARASAVLTPEQSAAIFQKDLANIIAKTRDGKPLTATERRVLRSVPTTGEPLPDVGLTIAALNEATAQTGGHSRSLSRMLNQSAFTQTGICTRSRKPRMAILSMTISEGDGFGWPADCHPPPSTGRRDSASSAHLKSWLSLEKSAGHERQYTGRQDSQPAEVGS